MCMHVYSLRMDVLMCANNAISNSDPTLTKTLLKPECCTHRICWCPVYVCVYVCNGCICIYLIVLCVCMFGCMPCVWMGTTTTGLIILTWIYFNGNNPETEMLWVPNWLVHLHVYICMYICLYACMCIYVFYMLCIVWIIGCMPSMFRCRPTRFNHSHMDPTITKLLLKPKCCMHQIYWCNYVVCMHVHSIVCINVFICII